MVNVSPFAEGFFSRSVMRVVLVQCSTAVLLGYVIGYVGVYGIMDGANQDCTSFTTDAACESVKFTECAWSAVNATCYFKDVDCSLFNEDMCRSHDDDCTYDGSNDQCTHRTGLSPTLMGVFAGAMTVGGMIGSVLAGFLVNVKGRKRVLQLGGLICVVASVLCHVARATNSFGVLVLSRLVAGIGTSIGCVVSPMYTEEMAPEPYTKVVGILFQMFLTVGIALAAFFGLVLMPSNTSVAQNMEARLQILNGVQTLLSCLSLGVYYYMSESSWFDKYVRGAPKPSQEEEEENSEPTEHQPLSITHSGFLYRGMDAATAEITWIQMVFPLVVAGFVCVAQQLTGINAIMNYAPTITKSMGLSSIMGNFVVMLWNFFTTLPSIFLATRLTMRQMFLVGTSMATLSVFLTGISIYPGIFASNVKDGLAGLGIFTFIAGFETGMGSTMYVFAQVLFPSAFRNRGASFVICTQYAFNLFINFMFPVVVSILSDGKEDQSFGIASVFIFFGFCGGIALIILFRFLFPFKEEIINAHHTPTTLTK